MAFEKSCRIIFFVACHMRTRFGGLCVFACTMGGWNHILPLAFGILETESVASWTYFLSNLKNLIPAINEYLCVAIHDQDKGLLQAHLNVLPNCEVGFCAEHVARNVATIFRTRSFHSRIIRAAKSLTELEFESVMQEIHCLDPRIHEYLISQGTSQWATCKGKVPRFGHVTSNSVEAMHWSFDEIRRHTALKTVNRYFLKYSDLDQSRRTQ